MQKEVDFYHTSDSCVTSGRGRLHRSRSRFFSDFGRLNCIEIIGASPGKDQGAGLMTRRRFASSRSLVLVACCLIGAGCAHDTYQERASLIKNHADAFYDSLKANRVESAIRYNAQIDAMAR